MAKGSILMGKQTGKLGQSVLSTRYGEQIQRAYVGTIANPKTEAQVATRSRFKLASQLSAAMADVIAIPRVGSKTGRNQFVSDTMEITSVSDGLAVVDLNKVQLTKSQRGLVGFAATRDTANNKISIALKGANGSDISRVVYVAFEKQNDGSLVQFDSKVISVAGPDGTFPAELKGSENSVVLYAYGITDKDGAASVKFGNLQAPTAEQVARLITTISNTLSGVSLTKTNGATMNTGINSCDSDEAEPITPTGNFDSVTINGVLFAGNFRDQNPGNVTITGFVTNGSSRPRVAVVDSPVNPPEAGQELVIVTDDVVSDDSGEFSLNFTSLSASVYYIVQGFLGTSGIRVTDVYPYYYGTADDQP